MSAPRSLARLLPGLLITAYVTALIVVGAAVFINGLGYYLTPFSARPDHPLYALYRPSGPIGLLLGIAGISLMLAMLLYTVRKWLMRVHFLGPLSCWMNFHIVCGIFGPIFILMHTSFQWPHGYVAIAFWCMTLVALSGTFGRFVYGHFPRTAAGREADLDDARKELADVRETLVRQTAGADPVAIGEAVRLARELDYQATSIAGLLWLDIERRRRSKLIYSNLAAAGLSGSTQSAAATLLIRQLRLKQSVEAWQVTRRLFRYWHLFHQPLTKAMYLLVSFHILTALLLGDAIQTLRDFFFVGAVG